MVYGRLSKLFALSLEAYADIAAVVDRNLDSKFDVRAAVLAGGDSSLELFKW